MTDAEIENRYAYHAPFGDQADRYADIRAACAGLAKLIAGKCPDSRERATALTHLDAVMFYANASIARNEKPPAATPAALPPCPWEVGARVRFYADAPGIPPGRVERVDNHGDCWGVVVRWDGWVAAVSYRPEQLAAAPDAPPSPAFRKGDNVRCPDKHDRGGEVVTPDDGTGVTEFRDAAGSVWRYATAALELHPNNAFIREPQS